MSQKTDEEATLMNPMRYMAVLAPDKPGSGRSDRWFERRMAYTAVFRNLRLQIDEAALAKMVDEILEWEETVRNDTEQALRGNYPDWTNEQINERVNEVWETLWKGFLEGVASVAAKDLVKLKGVGEIEIGNQRDALADNGRIMSELRKITRSTRARLNRSDDPPSHER
jgi:hypothetical protein